MKALDVPEDPGKTKKAPPKVDTEANAMSLITAASLQGLFSGGGTRDDEGDIFEDVIDADELAKNAIRVCAVDFCVHHIKGVLELSTEKATRVEACVSCLFPSHSDPLQALAKQIDLLVAVNEGSVGIDIACNSLWLKDLERTQYFIVLLQ